MLIIPVESAGHAHDMLVIVLGDENLARMAVADPVEIVLRDTGKRLVNPTVHVCHEKDGCPEFARVLQTRDLAKILEYLGRGWKYLPDRGDHDNGPTPLNRTN